jgi:hypothetical protein
LPEVAGSATAAGDGRGFLGDDGGGGVGGGAAAEGLVNKGVNALQSRTSRRILMAHGPERTERKRAREKGKSSIVYALLKAWTTRQKKSYEGIGGRCKKQQPIERLNPIHSL